MPKETDKKEEKEEKEKERKKTKKRGEKKGWLRITRRNKRLNAKGTLDRRKTTTREESRWKPGQAHVSFVCICIIDSRSFRFARIRKEFRGCGDDANAQGKIKTKSDKTWGSSDKRLEKNALLLNRIFTMTLTTRMRLQTIIIEDLILIE